MKKNLKNFSVIAVLAIILLSCNNKNQEKMETDKSELTEIFPKGEKGASENFTGNAYNIGLVDADSLLTTAVGNVYFEPGARSNWHSHPAGQILIITDGIGYHQIERQPIEVIKKGSVVKCPPNVRHWHGASAEVGLQQLYIVPNTEKGIVNWQEVVTDEVYKSVK
ncbi:cupin domain-containing protein [Chryseobacterium foetidum]|uniref:cupin domain-containing protein n=1 Tax=Chryseobacterium foetidum TaxID=2951057 RepID=UPI0021C70B2B|nr:cupin domain-containing protein [Chryseobacterium foetidum]